MPDTITGYFFLVYGYEEENFRIMVRIVLPEATEGRTFSEIETQINSIWAYNLLS